MDNILDHEITRDRDSRLRILVVEDNPDDQILIQRSLDKGLTIHFHLTIAETGLEGLKKLGEDAFDLILLDYRLPHMTGLEFLDELRIMDVDIPIIFLTGQGNLKIAVEAMKRGAQDYIVKDEIDSKHLVDTIKKIVQEIALPKDVNIETAKQILEALSSSPTIHVEPITTVKSDPEIGIRPHELVLTLKKLAEKQYIEALPLRSIIACPSCNSITPILYVQCPECRSTQISRGDALEHLSCGHVNFKHEFEKGESDLVCPKCGKKLKVLGVDFRKVEPWYSCSNGHFFGRPFLSFKCSICGEKYTLDEAIIKMLYMYQLADKGNQLLQIGLLDTELLDTENQLKHQDPIAT